MVKILLVASDWQFRALVRAQLLEAGYEVQALPSLRVALADQLAGARAPALTLLDVQGMELEPSMLRDLWQATARAPLVLCGGSLDRATLHREELPPARVVLRPFSVGELVREIRHQLESAGQRG